MPDSHLARCLNIALRGLTLVSKFVLVLLLAKFLAPERLGLFGLFAATIGYVLYVVGFEFYTYATRELIGAQAHHRFAMVRDQAIFYVLAYTLALPLLLLVFNLGWLPWSLLPWLVVLLVLEHTAQELTRILVALSQPLVASAVMFLRSGAWCWLVLAAMWLRPETRQLWFVFAAWCLSAAIACAVGLLKVLQLRRGSVPKPIDWRWLVGGLKVAAPLLLASLSFRGIFTVDRYWVQSISGLGPLGAYVLFVGMASAVLSFLDAGVIDFMYPRLVSAARSGNVTAFRAGMATLRRHIIVATTVLVFCCWLIAEPLVRWLGKPLYLDNLPVLNWLLLAVALYALGMIAHVGLYALGKDRSLVFSQLAGFATFLLAATVLPASQGPVTVAVAMCFAFGVMLIWKLLAYRSIQRSNVPAAA